MAKRQQVLLEKKKATPPEGSAAITFTMSIRAYYKNESAKLAAQQAPKVEESASAEDLDKSRR